MSKSIRQTALSGLLGSKRFIVAVCGAIAMVLGALSVGASFFVPQSAAETQHEQAASSPVFTERGNKTNANTSRENGGLFTSQQVLVPNIIGQRTTNSVSIVVPAVKAGLGIEIGPVKAGNSINLGGLQVSVEAPQSPLIEAPVLPSTPLELPEAEGAPQEETPKAEPPEETPTPPAEEPAPNATPQMDGFFVEPTPSQETGQ